MSAAPATTPVFLGGPPAPQPTTYICRIHVYLHDPTDVWSRGALILPSGVRIPWIAYSDGVHRHQSLFQSHTRVAVTAYCLAGDWYLTGIRSATDTEWQDADDALAQYRATPAA